MWSSKQNKPKTIQEAVYDVAANKIQNKAWRDLKWITLFCRSLQHQYVHREQRQ